MSIDSGAQQRLTTRELNDITIHIDKKYMCPICLAHIEEPMQTSCGHRFCKSCINKVACGFGFGLMKCPVDNTWFHYDHELFPDNAFEREMLSETVDCGNGDLGCTWSGELRKVQNHLDSCDFAAFDCENGCIDPVLRKDLADHQANCANRPVKCSHCGKSLKYGHLTRHEVLECAMFPVRCTLCSQWGIKRQDIQRHLDMVDGDCPQGMVVCPYRKYGCQYQVKRIKLSNHENECASKHLTYVEKKVTAQAREIETINENLQELKGLLESSLSQYQILLRELADTNNMSYTGNLLWKINIDPDLTKYNSKPFYSGVPGCKLLISLEFGHMDHGVEHVSLYVTLEPGKFDEELQFPFSFVCKVLVLSDKPEVNIYRQDITCANMPRSREGSVNQQRELTFMPLVLFQEHAFGMEGNFVLQISVKHGLQYNEGT